MLSRGAGALGLLALAGCGGGGAGGGTTSGPTPTPTPTPPAIVDGITIEGTLRTPVAIDTLTTRSGHWKFSDLGTTGGSSHAYLWRLDENPDFVRVMICRRAFTVEANDTGALSIQTVPVSIQDRGHSYSWSLGVAQGACRIMQNMEPVAANAGWLREAVTQLRIPAYRRERAWLPFTPTTLAPDTQRGAYDPSSLGPIPGSTATPNAELNFVGVTSAQGGEYSSSRGFLHNADARVVDAALHNEDSLITAFMPEFTQYTFYSLAQPQAAVWSTTNKITADPQFPYPGDTAYEIARAASRTRPDIDSLIPADGWSRDESHLENTAFVHWILTEDPVAGMAVQRQLAYHLGNFYESDRGTLPSYYIQLQQERGVYNGLSALWKARDVSRKVSSLNGTVIWPTARTEKMATEGIASIDSQSRMFPARDVAAITGSPLSQIQGAGEWQRRDGGTIFYASESAFMTFQYGKEPLWLWTKDGNATVREWFRARARQAVVRALYIGGALGVDRAEDIAGSAYPLGPSTVDAGGRPIPAPTPFANDLEWAAWVRAQPIAVQPTDSYNNASIHTALQMQALLLFAKNAGLPIPDLDAAIARMEADKGRTTAYRFADIQMHKHMSTPN